MAAAAAEPELEAAPAAAERVEPIPLALILGLADRIGPMNGTSALRRIARAHAAGRELHPVVGAGAQPNAPVYGGPGKARVWIVASLDTLRAFSKHQAATAYWRQQPLPRFLLPYASLSEAAAVVYGACRRPLRPTSFGTLGNDGEETAWNLSDRPPWRPCP